MLTVPANVLSLKAATDWNGQPSSWHPSYGSKDSDPDIYFYGAHGLSDDRRQLTSISSDEFFLGQADDLCMEILRQNRAIVLVTASQIERYGQIVAPWL